MSDYLAATNQFATARRLLDLKGQRHRQMTNLQSHIHRHYSTEKDGTSVGSCRQNTHVPKRG